MIDSERGHEVRQLRPFQGQLDFQLVAIEPQVATLPKFPKAGNKYELPSSSQQKRIGTVYARLRAGRCLAVEALDQRVDRECVARRANTLGRAHTARGT